MVIVAGWLLVWLGCPWPCADQGAGQRRGGKWSKAKCKQPDQNITYFFPTPFYAPGPINHLKILIELFQPKYSSIFSLPNDFLLWHRLNARFCRELKNTFDDLTVLRWLLCGARRAAAALSLALCKCSENRRKNKCSLVLFGLYPMICDFWFTLYTWVHSSEPETVKTNVGAGRANCLLALNRSNGLHIHYLLAQCCLSAMKTFYSLVEILSSEEECD